MCDDGVFTREFEIESLDKTLVLYQKEVGDVSCVVWDASLVLARYLEGRVKVDNSWLQGKKVLELGAGLGCVSITAACFGADVIASDLPDVLPLLDRNISANKEVWSSRGGLVKSAQLKWGEISDLDPPNLLLLADCIYYMESVEPLIQTMCQVTNEMTEIIICQEERDTEKQRAVWVEFTTKLIKYFQVTKVPLSEQHPLFSSPDIVVLKASRILHSS